MRTSQPCSVAANMACGQSSGSATPALRSMPTWNAAIRSMSAKWKNAGQSACMHPPHSSLLRHCVTSDFIVAVASLLHTTRPDPHVMRFQVMHVVRNCYILCDYGLPASISASVSARLLARVRQFFHVALIFEMRIGMHSASICHWYIIHSIDA